MAYSLGKRALSGESLFQEISQLPTVFRKVEFEPVACESEMSSTSPHRVRGSLPFCVPPICFFEIITHHLFLNLLPSSISPFFLLLSSIFHNLPAGFSDISLLAVPVFSYQFFFSPPFHPPLLWPGGKVEETTEMNTRTEWPRESTHTTFPSVLISID